VTALEQPLPLLEVLQLDPLLRLLDGSRHQPAGDDLALLRAALVHPARDPVRPEQPHQVVFEGEEEDALARIALAAGAAAELAIDAARFVPLRADDLEAGLRLRQVERLVEFDVGAATGHVGGDRDRPLLPRPGHDLGLPLVVLGVQHLVLEAPALELA
jgi:hypothetical protein